VHRFSRQSTQRFHDATTAVDLERSTTSTYPPAALRAPARALPRQGVVFEAKILETGETVAIKKVLQDKRFKNRELQIMRLLDHPNVVQLKHSFFSTADRDDVYLNLVLEFVPDTVYRIIKHYAKRNQVRRTRPLNPPPLRFLCDPRPWCSTRPPGHRHRRLSLRSAGRLRAGLRAQ
jgi:hypothetical protein